MLIKCFFILRAFNFAISAPKSWPYMKTYDIWGSDNNTIETHSLKSQFTFMDTSNSYNNLLDVDSTKTKIARGRKGKGE